MTRKVSLRSKAHFDVDPVKLDVLRLISRRAAPPASAFQQVQELVRLDLIFYGKSGYRLTAVGQELVDNGAPDPLSPTRAFSMGYAEGTRLRELGMPLENNERETLGPVSEPAAFRSDFEAGFKSGLRGEPSMPVTS